MSHWPDKPEPSVASATISMEQIPEKLVAEARCEITWGRSRADVLALLQSKGIGDRYALELINELMRERAAIIRSDGIKKSVVGAIGIAVPIAYYFFSIWLGYWSLKLFALLIVVGVYGIAKLTDGLTMILRPQSNTESLANDTG